jgi:ketosteroid isomerase-like protein
MLRPAYPSRLLLTPLLLLSLIPAMGQDAPHHGRKLAKQQITELEAQWKDATMTGNTAEMDKLLSDDYVGISWNGQVNTKAMQLDRLRSRTLSIKRMDLSDIKIKIVGAVAIVTSRAQIESNNTDGNALSGEFRYTRIYQRVPSGGWKITNFEATRIPPDRMHRAGGASS